MSDQPMSFKQVLENFKNINNGVVFKKGLPIATADDSSSIVAISTINAEWDFAVTDLSNFLAMLALTSGDRKISVTDTNGVSVMTVDDGQSRFKYGGGYEHLIITPPDDMSGFTDLDFVNEVVLPEHALKRLTRAAATLASNSMVFFEKNNKMYVSIEDVDVVGSNRFEMSLEVPADAKGFRAIIPVNHLKIASDDYVVSFDSDGMAARFQSEDMTYYIIMEA